MKVQLPASPQSLVLSVSTGDERSFNQGTDDDARYVLVIIFVVDRLGLASAGTAQHWCNMEPHCVLIEVFLLSFSVLLLKACLGAFNGPEYSI